MSNKYLKLTFFSISLKTIVWIVTHVIFIEEIKIKGYYTYNHFTPEKLNKPAKLSIKYC